MIEGRKKGRIGAGGKKKNIKIWERKTTLGKKNEFEKLGQRNKWKLVRIKEKLENLEE